MQHKIIMIYISIICNHIPFIIFSTKWKQFMFYLLAPFKEISFFVEDLSKLKKISLTKKG